MKKLLLHICCAPCGSGCVTHPLITGNEYRIGRLFFSNSNLDSLAEYEKRLDSVVRLGKYYGIEVEADPYDHEAWLEAVRGYENEPERGLRCAKCFRYSLSRSARRAEQTGEVFATTLTVSPHKSSKLIFEIGSEFSNFAALDFKKQDGFLNGRRFAVTQSYYFQNYCGCEFSRREAEERIKAKKVEKK